ncbi:MAG: HAMP domain-containing sensor histidine kinase [Verrucomicrobiota bacterium]
MRSFFTRRNQLQWLGLLGLAVVLPSVSLLWFMNRVIANERLVVRQKLAALYQDKLAEAAGKTDALFTNRLATLDHVQPGTNPYAAFRRLVLENNFQGLVIWNADGTVVYPRTGELSGNDMSPGSPLAGAWHEEFAKRDYTQAVQLYNRFTTDADSLVAIGAVAGKSRCLAKLGRRDEAITACQTAAFATVPENAAPTLRPTIETARLLLLSLLKQSTQPQHGEIFHRTITALMDDLYNSDDSQTALPANQNLFIAQKVLAALRGPFPFADQAAKTQLEKLVAAEEFSLAAAETLQPFTSQFDGLFQTELEGKPCYALRHRTKSATLLVALSDAGITAMLSGYHTAFHGTAAAYRILDTAGNFVSGTQAPQSKAFATVAMPDGFPGWKVELYFEGSDVFEKAARRQIAVYTWTGFLVILLIISIGGFATRAVGRQIRLNEMKNDFIATVSHELKTPLASMRVLVDTLLEGRVKDEAQVQRYLELTAKENERLSRMIDNFLTFSRMERNKVAFTIVDTKPTVIANDAVAAIKTKYDSHDCQLTLEIPNDLPDLPADHDAIVTVLVNLLDNACKYTTDHKKVSLRLYPEDRAVCFAVSDNGIGLARRHHRKIFDRFYQVDNSLSRKAEGCGLGLSIVKFIVDAHQGKISVESKPGSGSTFTVRLPASPRNGEGKE